MTESDYTKSTNPEHFFEEQSTHYKWSEDDQTADSLILSNRVKIKKLSN